MKQGAALLVNEKKTPAFPRQGCYGKWSSKHATAGELSASWGTCWLKGTAGKVHCVGVTSFPNMWDGSSYNIKMRGKLVHFFLTYAVLWVLWIESLLLLYLFLFYSWLLGSHLSLLCEINMHKMCAFHQRAPWHCGAISIPTSTSSMLAVFLRVQLKPCVHSMLTPHSPLHLVMAKLHAAFLL